MKAAATAAAEGIHAAAPAAGHAAARPAAVRLNPAKLVGSKWTACAPVDKEKHFMLVALVEPVPPAAVDYVTMEAVYTGRQFVIAWRQLRQRDCWRQGWLAAAGADR